MVDDINISYSIDTGPPTTPAPALDDALLAFTSCERVELGNGSVLLLNRDNGAQMTVSAEVATALTYCNTFRTLQDHAQLLVNTIPQLQGQLDNVAQVLATVREAGLLLDARTISERLQAPAEAAPALAPTRVCVLTCDRPAALERLLDSMLRAGNLSRHEQLFLVDDSRADSNREQNRELVVKFNLTSTRNMQYVGAEAQGELLARLAAAAPGDAAAIRFLIDRERWAAQPSYGLARTLCLLLTVGYRCVVLDDDILCRSVLPPGASAGSPREGISFGGGANRELDSYGSEQALIQKARFGEFDPLSGHARCLGMPLAGAIAELDAGAIGPTALQNGNAAMLNSLDADSPVLVTQCGSWGDPGTQGSSWLFELGEESVRRLLAGPGGLAGARQHRYYWLGRAQPNVSKMAVMSQATGLDNSQLLPPYFPVLRDEDYLFASMLLYLHPRSAVLDYPWSVPHLPLSPRGTSGAGEQIAASGGLGLCARYLADQVDGASGVSPHTRLAKLAVLLRELSERDSDELLALFRTELAREQAGQLQQLGRQLQRAPALGSQDWTDFLQGGLDEVNAALQAPAYPGATASPEAAQAMLQQAGGILAEFSAAIAAWPAIRASAAGITAELLAEGLLKP